MRPPRPSDVGTTSWSKALDLYLASYDASGHAEFSGGVSARVAPAEPLSEALPVSEPPAVRAPLALMDDNRADQEIRRRLNERLTRGTRVSERRQARAGAHQRAHLLGWSRNSATRLDDARRDVSQTHTDARSRQGNDRGDRDDREHYGSKRFDADSTSPDAVAAGRVARAARRPPPQPVRQSRSAFSGRSFASASASSPSASSTSSSWSSSRVEGEGDEEEEEAFDSAARDEGIGEGGRRSGVGAIAEDPPLSPEARAAARVDALLADLGVVVFSPGGDTTHVRAATGPSRRIAPAPGSAPLADSSARRSRASPPKRKPKTLPGNAAQGRERVASSATSPSSPRSSDSEARGSDTEFSSDVESSAGSTRSRSTACEGTNRPGGLSSADPDAEASSVTRSGGPGRDAGSAQSRSGPDPGGAFHALPALGSTAQAPRGTNASQPPPEDLEDVSLATSGSLSESDCEGPLAGGDDRLSCGDFLAEEVRLSLEALEQIRKTHSLPVSPAESPGAAERAAARAARRARRESGELDEDAGSAAATLFRDALELSAAPPPASPSGLTGAARVRMMYPELFA